MRTRKLGSQGLEVPALGLGCMGMTIQYGELDDVESIATIHHSLDLGGSLLNTSAAGCALLYSASISVRSRVIVRR